MVTSLAEWEWDAVGKLEMESIGDCFEVQAVLHPICFETIPKVEVIPSLVDWRMRCCARCMFASATYCQRVTSSISTGEL